MFTSAITGVMLMLIVYVAMTAFECYKESKVSNASFGRVFIGNLFSKESMISLVLMFVFGLGLAFLGMLFIGLAIFFCPY